MYCRSCVYLWHSKNLNNDTLMNINGRDTLVFKSPITKCTCLYTKERHCMAKRYFLARPASFQGSTPQLFSQRVHVARKAGEWSPTHCEKSWGAEPGNEAIYPSHTTRNAYKHIFTKTFVHYVIFQSYIYIYILNTNSCVSTKLLIITS